MEKRPTNEASWKLASIPQRERALADASISISFATKRWKDLGYINKLNLQRTTIEVG